MAAELHVELVAPDRQVWSGEAELVIAKTPEGDVGVMAGHQPMLATLVEGVVRIRRSGDEVRAAVHGGFLSVSDRGVSVLAEVVEMADEIDVARARQAYERNQGAAEDDEAGRARLRRAQARLRAAGETVAH